VYGVAGIFKGLSQDGIREDFSKNPRASLFNEDLSNEPNFGRMYYVVCTSAKKDWANQEIKKIYYYNLLFKELKRKQ
jgi:hypothetical protein